MPANLITMLKMIGYKTDCHIHSNTLNTVQWHNALIDRVNKKSISDNLHTKQISSDTPQPPCKNWTSSTLDFRFPQRCWSRVVIGFKPFWSQCTQALCPHSQPCYSTIVPDCPQTYTFWTSSVSKKEEPKCYYLTKSPVNEPPSRIPNMAPKKRPALFQSLLLHISWVPQ